MSLSFSIYPLSYTPMELVYLGNIPEDRQRGVNAGPGNLETGPAGGPGGASQKVLRNPVQERDAPSRQGMYTVATARVHINEMVWNKRLTNARSLWSSMNITLCSKLRFLMAIFTPASSGNSDGPRLPADGCSVGRW